MAGTFFQNRDCEYFPCHRGVSPEDFNCLFCYCPLYTLGEDCGGSFYYNDKGRKSCIGCTRPHERGSEEYIRSRYEELAALAGKRSGGWHPPAENTEGSVLILAFSRQGSRAARDLAEKLGEMGFNCRLALPGRIAAGERGDKPDPDADYKRGDKPDPDICNKRADASDIKSTATFAGDASDIKSAVASSFKKGNTLIFVGAAGIAVRYIAPLVRDKREDPAVLVMDENCRHVIPILSGHLGGANEMAGAVARAVGAQAVITTASDMAGIEAPDVYAKRMGCAIGDMNAAARAAALALEGNEISYRISPFIKDPVSGREDIKEPASGREDEVWLIPPATVLGAGCRKGTDPVRLREAVIKILDENDISPLSVAAVATLDIKGEEEALRELASYLGCPLVTRSASQLMALEGDFEASAFVLEKTGTDNVCERAAMAVAGELFGERGSRLFIKKTILGGITLAAAVGKEWLIP